MLEILHGPGGGAMQQVALTVDVFSRYGVIFLLFRVGLGTSLDEMRQVAASGVCGEMGRQRIPALKKFSADKLGVI